MPRGSPRAGAASKDAKKGESPKGKKKAGLFSSQLGHEEDVWFTMPPGLPGGATRISKIHLYVSSLAVPMEVYSDKDRRSNSARQGPSYDPQYKRARKHHLHVPGLGVIECMHRHALHATSSSGFFEGNSPCESQGSDDGSDETSEHRSLDGSSASSFGLLPSVSTAFYREDIVLPAQAQAPAKLLQQLQKRSYKAQQSLQKWDNVFAVLLDELMSIVERGKPPMPPISDEAAAPVEPDVLAIQDCCGHPVYSLLKAIVTGQRSQCSDNKKDAWRVQFLTAIQKEFNVLMTMTAGVQALQLSTQILRFSCGNIEAEVGSRSHLTNAQREELARARLEAHVGITKDVVLRMSPSLSRTDSADFLADLPVVDRRFGEHPESLFLPPEDSRKRSYDSTRQCSYDLSVRGGLQSNDCSSQNTLSPHPSMQRNFQQAAAMAAVAGGVGLHGGDSWHPSVNVDFSMDEASFMQDELGAMSPTWLGERRLRFWDGFFKFREFGAVCRELAANPGTKAALAKIDNPEAMLALTTDEETGGIDRVDSELKGGGLPLHLMLSSLQTCARDWSKRFQASRSKSPRSQHPFWGNMSTSDWEAISGSSTLLQAASLGIGDDVAAFLEESPKGSESSMPPIMEAVPESIFPALRERKGNRLAVALRRPPGATALPLPVSERRRPPDAEGSLPTSAQQSQSARGPKPTPKGLPSLGATEGARSLKTARSSSRTGGQDGMSCPQTPRSPRSAGLQPQEAALSLPLPPAKSKALRAPMFMGSGEKVTSARPPSPPLPFTSHGIGFDVNPCARTQGGHKAEAPPAPFEPPAPAQSISRKKTFAILGKDSGEAASRRKTPEREAAPRCAYCSHHDIEAAPVNANGEPDARRPRKAADPLNSSKRLQAFKKEPVGFCASCGDPLDAPFRPRALSMVFRDLVDDYGNGVLVAFLPDEAGGAAPYTSELSRANSRANSMRLLKSGASSGCLSEGLQGVDVGGSEVESLEDELSASASAALSKLLSGRSAFGSPRRVLSTMSEEGLGSDGGMYFSACQHLRARPNAQTASALTESVSPAVTKKKETLTSTATCTVAIQMRNAEMDDGDLTTLLTGLKQKAAAYDGVADVHVDLSGNWLTDKAMKRLLSQLDEPLDWAKGLKSLDIGRNQQLTFATLEPLCTLMQAERLQRLNILRVSGIDLGEAFAQKFFKSILHRQAALVRQCTRLWVLDISGNHLQAEAMAAMGRALADAGSLRAVHIAHNSGSRPAQAAVAPQDFAKAARSTGGFASNPAAAPPFQPLAGGGSAIGAMCDELSMVRSLRLLDLRDSQVDSDCAFMLAVSLSMLQDLELVLLSGNPLGDQGVRALVSLAMLPERPWQRRRASGRRISSSQQAPQQLRLSIDPIAVTATPPGRLCVRHDPTGSYALDMRDVRSRVWLIHLLNRWTALPQSSRPAFEQTFVNADLDGKAWKEPPMDREDMWEVPQKGTLTFTFFAWPSGPPGRNKAEPWLHRRSGRRLLVGITGQAAESPLLQGTTPEARLLELAASCRQPEALMAVIRAAAADFHVQPATVLRLCHWLEELGGLSTQEQQREAVLTCFEGAALDATSEAYAKPSDALPHLLPLLNFVSPLMSRTAGAAAPALERDGLSSMHFLSLSNPTGHYIFDLCVPSDRLAAEHLLLINAWTVQQRSVNKEPDLSQVGNMQCLRNEMFDGMRFVYHSDWCLPARGQLEFDFVAPRRPEKAAKPLADEPWGFFEEAFLNARGPGCLRALCLRRVAATFVMTSKQALALLRTAAIICKRTGEMHALVLVELTMLCSVYFRIKDYVNIHQTLFEGKTPFSPLQRYRVCEAALGKLNVVDPVRINGLPPPLAPLAPRHLHLNVHEDRQVARMIVTISHVEGAKNGVDPTKFAVCSYGPSEKEQHRIPAGVPPEWWQKTSLPLHGVFTVAYVHEDAGNINVRKRFARQMCGWA
eukprot:TRINITY_DN47467_c0_g1_i1.p1 TRINITY_DN47467_c0_g1~~TRINITY_DN47467_c0_g1_i1.p1  ORF type:complete len:1949 (-),score=493.08 TRINITY_DN47467_c0_g1_i1:248-6094(-)